MYTKTLVLMLAFLIFIHVPHGSLTAQSMDKDNPTSLQSSEVTGISRTTRDGYWYTLTAGPGELIMEMEVHCWNRYNCTSGVQMVLYTTDMQEILNESLFTDGRAMRTKTVKHKVKDKQDFLLSVKSGRRLGTTTDGTYVIRFKGSIVLPKEEKEEKD